MFPFSNLFLLLPASPLRSSCRPRSAPRPTPLGYNMLPHLPVVESETIFASTTISFVAVFPSSPTQDVSTTDLFYVDKSKLCFGLLTIDHATNTTSSREIAHHFISPTRIAISGDASLSRQPFPTDYYLPTTDEASHNSTTDLTSHYDHLLRRSLPKVFILDEGDSSSTSSIYVYDPHTDEVNLLAVGLKNASGLTCTPSSDLLFFEDCAVRKKNSTSSRAYTTRCVRCISGRDVLDYSSSQTIVPPSLVVSLFPLPPSLISGGLVAPLLRADGAVVVGARRRGAANVDPSSAGRHTSASSSGGVVVSFTPEPT